MMRFAKSTSFHARLRISLFRMPVYSATIKMGRKCSAAAAKSRPISSCVRKRTRPGGSRNKRTFLTGLASANSHATAFENACFRHANSLFTLAGPTSLRRSALNCSIVCGVMSTSRLPPNHRAKTTMHR
ncbi:MAG: hypothetical protein AB1644_08350 [Candidatus Zixiibacteriota bacterium]